MPSVRSRKIVSRKVASDRNRQPGDDVGTKVGETVALAPDRDRAQIILAGIIGAQPGGKAGAAHRQDGIRAQAAEVGRFAKGIRAQFDKLLAEPTRQFHLFFGEAVAVIHQHGLVFKTDALDEGA